MSSSDEFDCDYIAVRLMMGFFQVLGLAPYTPTRIVEFKMAKRGVWQTNLSIDFTSSRSCGLYNICLIIILLGIIYARNPASMDAYYPGRTNVTETIEIVGIVVGIFVTMIIWIVQAYHRKTAATLLNRLVRVNRILTDLIDHEVMDESLIFYCIRLIVMDIVIYAAFILTDQQSYNTDPMLYLIVVLPNFVVSIFMAQYTIAVKTIEQRFKMINRSFCLLGTEIASNLEQILSLDGNNYSSMGVLGKIKILKYEHANLYAIARELADMNSLGILITFAHMAHLIIHNSYFFVMPFLRPVPGYNNWMATNAAFSLMTEILPITAFAISITSVMSEVVTRFLPFLDRENSDMGQKSGKKHYF